MSQKKTEKQYFKLKLDDKKITKINNHLSDDIKIKQKNKINNKNKIFNNNKY